MTRLTLKKTRDTFDAMRDFQKKLSQQIQLTQRPIAVFDLDGTLFDVTWRTIEIMKRFAAEPTSKDRYHSEFALLRNISHENFKYSLEQNLNELGITRHSERGASFIREAQDYWFKHFFTDEGVLWDRAYAGASACVHWFVNQGVRIVYLSGRDVPNMSRGTLTALERDGFPHKGDRISLVLKPDFHMDDLLFKKQSMEIIKSEGGVVATFDNEPANVQMFLNEFPEAWSVHYQSAFAKHLELSGPKFIGVNTWTELGF